MEVFSSFVILFLFVTDVTQAPPSRVMPNIIVQRLLKGSLCLSEVLVINMLMATEGVSIGVLRVQLDGPCKEL